MAATLPEDETLASAESAYRQAFWKIIGHTVFFVACCAVAILARRIFKMPPALLTVAFFVALALFGGDLWRFITCRRRLERMRAENSN